MPVNQTRSRSRSQAPRPRASHANATPAARGLSFLAALATISALALSSLLTMASPAAALGVAPASTHTNMSATSASTRAKNVCARPTLAAATCTAQMLVNKRTGRAVSFHVKRLRLTRAGTRVINASSRGHVHAHIADTGVISEPAATLGTPQYLQQAYDLTALSATAGTGDTVGIVDVGVGYQSLESDLAQYRAAYDLPPCGSASGCLRVVDQNGGSNYATTNNGNSPGWGFETALDVDAVSAICPNCHILLVEADSETLSDLEAAQTTAYRLGANQISDSWLEFWSFNPSDFVFPGVATVASAGDYGYLSAPYSTPYPASFPGVTAAGGTALTPASSPTARGVNETAADYDSSSCSNEAQPPWQAEANGGCSGRAVADLSADGETDTGLYVYYSGDATLSGYTGGGTSLSAAIIAAYYGLIGNGIGVGGAAWAYNDASLLNDITVGNNEGSNGVCEIALTALCNAGVGYDGITGVGSISGDVTPGAPGVANGTGCNCAGDGGTYIASATSVHLSGGVYPNQLPTRYWWEYGPTDAYGQTTSPTDIGDSAGAVAVSNTISGLNPDVNYHYALVAQNSQGTVTYGDGGFTLDVTAAAAATPPPTPDVTFTSATSNSTTSVTLQGQVNPEGSLTTYYFAEGIADPSGACEASALNYGTDFFPAPVPGSLGTESTPFAVTQTLNDLTPGVTYCFGLIAFNAGGTSVSANTDAPTPHAPTVAISNAPLASSTSTVGEVGFVVDGEVDTTTCTLDGISVSCDGGSADFTGLSVGSHTFVVVVSGVGGASTVSTSWQVLAPPPPAPSVTLTSTPPASSTSTSAEVDFALTGEVDTTTCTLDGVNVSCDGGVADFTGLSMGSHIFVVVASGAGGSNTASTTWTVVAPPPPTPAPSVVLTSVPPANTTATSGSVLFSVSGEVDTTTCTLDGVDTACDSGSVDFTNLSLGAHTAVIVVSGVGGTDTVSTSWEVVAPPPPAPSVTLTSVPPASSSSTSGEVAFTVSGADNTTCTLDNVDTACDSGSVAFANLSVGAHTLAVAVSGPGGTISVTFSWTVTTLALAPAPVLAPAPNPVPVPTLTPTKTPSVVVTPKTSSSHSPAALSWSALAFTPNACSTQMKTCATHTPKFSFVLTKSAQITIILSQTVEGKTRVAARVLVNESAGAHSYTLPASYSGHGLAAGTYQITAQATTSSQHSSVFHAQLRVR